MLLLIKAPEVEMYIKTGRSKTDDKAERQQL